MSDVLLEQAINITTYKPGWTLTYEPTKYGRPVLRIQATVPDSNDPSREVHIDHIFDVTHSARVLPALWIARCVKGVELHELGEWLRFGGERPFLPFHGTPGNDDGDPYKDLIG